MRNRPRVTISWPSQGSYIIQILLCLWYLDLAACSQVQHATDAGSASARGFRNRTEQVMFWWLPAGGVQRIHRAESWLSPPFLIVYSPLEDSVLPAGTLPVVWKVKQNMIGNVVRVVLDEVEEHTIFLVNALEELKVHVEPGIHQIYIALFNRSCDQEINFDKTCEIVSYTIGFSIVEQSLAWQEPEKPFVISAADLDGRFLHPPARLICDGHIQSFWHHICNTDAPPAASKQVMLRIFKVVRDGICCTAFRINILEKLDFVWDMTVDVFLDGDSWIGNANGEYTECALEPGPHVLTVALRADNGTRTLLDSALSHIFVENGGCDSVSADGNGWLSHHDGTDPQGHSTAWATMVYSESYLAGALTMLHSLQRACAGRTPRHFILIATPPLTADMQTLNLVLSKMGVILRWVTPYASPHDPNRPEDLLSYTKLNLWNLTEYEKVVYLDADSLVRVCPDDMFTYPYLFIASSMPSNRHTSGPANRPSYQAVQLTSCALLVQPSEALFEELLEGAETMFSYDGTDMGFLDNFFFSRYPASSGLMVPSIVTWKGTYSIYREVWTSMQVRAVDFSGAPKPWELPWVGEARPGYKHHDPFYMANYFPLFLEWWEAYWSLCRLVPPTDVRLWRTDWKLAAG